MNATESALFSNGSTCLFKKTFTWTLLFITGLIIGLAFFFQKDILWQHLINKTFRNYESISLIRHDLTGAGWNRATVNNLEISLGEQNFFFPEVRVRIGLKPFFQAAVNTGPEIILRLETLRNLSALGEIDLSRLLPGREISGSLWIDADIAFDARNEPPSGGSIELKSKEKLHLKDFLGIKNMSLSAILTENRLELINLYAEEPTEFTCTGHILLNWGNLMRSTYSVQGHLSLGDDKISFEQHGLVSDFLP